MADERKRRKIHIESVEEWHINRMYCPSCGHELIPVAEGGEMQRGVGLDNPNVRTSFFLECDNQGKEHVLGRKWKVTQRERLPRPE